MSVYEYILRAKQYNLFRNFARSLISINVGFQTFSCPNSFRVFSQNTLLVTERRELPPSLASVLAGLPFAMPPEGRLINSKLPYIRPDVKQAANLRHGQIVRINKIVLLLLCLCRGLTVIVTNESDEKAEEEERCLMNS